MRLISWNVAARTNRLPEQAEVLASQTPDYIALQEVTQNTAALFRALLQASGWPHVADSFERAPDRSILKGPRRYGQLIASRWPIRKLPARQFKFSWRE